MTRKLRPLQIDDLDRLPIGCAGCAFWESSGERERRCGATIDPELQRAWFRRVTDEWGECGRVAYEDDEVLGFIKYAPSGYFPQAATFSPAPDDPIVPLISCLHIAPDARHRGLGRVLLRAALRDLMQRGERRVEAFAFALSRPPTSTTAHARHAVPAPQRLHRSSRPHPTYRSCVSTSSLAVLPRRPRGGARVPPLPAARPRRAPASLSNER